MNDIPVYKKHRESSLSYGEDIPVFCHTIGLHQFYVSDKICYKKANRDNKKATTMSLR